MLIHWINCWSEWTWWAGGAREYFWPLFQVTKASNKWMSVLQCPGIILQNQQTRFFEYISGPDPQLLSWGVNHILASTAGSFPLSCRGWPLPTSTEDHFKLWVKEIFRQLCSSPCSHLFKARRQWRLSFYLSTGKFECSDQKIQACSLLSLSSFEWLHCEALTIMS